MARNARSAPARSPAICADCAESSSASGSPATAARPRRPTCARRLQIAGADGDQTARNSEIALHGAAVAEEQRDLLRRAQDAAHDRPQQNERAITSATRRQRRHHHRGLDAVAEPGDGDFARAGRRPRQSRAAISASESRNRITRIIAPSWLPERARRVGGELPRGGERGLARLGLVRSSVRRRAHRCPAACRDRRARQRCRPWPRRPRCAPARRKASSPGGASTGRRAPACRRWPAGVRGSRLGAFARRKAFSMAGSSARNSCASACLLGTPCRAKGASGAKALLVGAERFGLRQVGRKGRAARDRVAQSRRARAPAAPPYRSAHSWRSRSRAVLARIARARRCASARRRARPATIRRPRILAASCTLSRNSFTAFSGGIGALARLRGVGGDVVAALVERGERDAERLHGAVGGGQALGHALVAAPATWRLSCSILPTRCRSASIAFVSVGGAAVLQRRRSALQRRDCAPSDRRAASRAGSRPNSQSAARPPADDPAPTKPAANACDQSGPLQRRGGRRRGAALRRAPRLARRRTGDRTAAASSVGGEIDGRRRALLAARVLAGAVGCALAVASGACRLVCHAVLATLVESAQPAARITQMAQTAPSQPCGSAPEARSAPLRPAAAQPRCCRRRRRSAARRSAPTGKNAARRAPARHARLRARRRGNSRRCAWKNAARHRPRRP